MEANESQLFAFRMDHASDIWELELFRRGGHIPAREVRPYALSFVMIVTGMSLPSTGSSTGMADDPATNLLI